jgi:hypothetical protein
MASLADENKQLSNTINMDENVPNFNTFGPDYDKSPPKKRFASVSDDARSKLLEGLTAKSTKASTKIGVGVFRSWITETGRNVTFEKVSRAALDTILQDFYMEVRNKKGEQYKSNSFKSIRHAINRHLQDNYEHGTIDIVNDTDFSESTKCFKAMIKENKKHGLGDTQHHEPLEVDDLKAVYKYFGSEFLTNNVILQEKVLFDLIIHLARRGRENLRELTKNHFKVYVDSKKCRYVHCK